MKKLITAFAIILTLAFTLVSCGDDIVSNNNNNQNNNNDNQIQLENDQLDFQDINDPPKSQAKKDEMIFHGAQISDEGVIFGVLIYLYSSASSPPESTEEKINYTIYEYIDAPMNYMFQQYDSADGVYSENMSILIPRINMRDAASDGNSLYSEGRIEMTVSGNSMIYYVFFDSSGADSTMALSRITEKDVEELYGY